MRIFLAGAAGVIGRRLVPLLVNDGHSLTGTTRSAERAEWLRERSVAPVIVDMFDADAVRAAVVAAAPEVVIHQLTDLPQTMDPADLPNVLARNARIRDEGTRNLVAGAAVAGARRFIAQSIAFAYAPGPTPHRERDALNVAAEGNAGISARGVESLERRVLGGPFMGIVLRYGRLYGPGAPEQAAAPGVHVDAAADAARCAVTCGAAGLYNVCDDDGFADSSAAKAALGWSPAFRSRHHR